MLLILYKALILVRKGHFTGCSRKVRTGPRYTRDFSLGSVFHWGKYHELARVLEATARCEL
jgi:hypothetical protein